VFQFLNSGGVSALFELPIEAAITLDDLQTINRARVGVRRSDF
jgi:glycerate-2-kinase